LKLKKFNDKEYIFDNNTDEKIENKVNGVSSIKYIINSNLYINFNEKGGFENDERIVLHLDYNIAPIQLAILPLMKKQAENRKGISACFF